MKTHRQIPVLMPSFYIDLSYLEGNPDDIIKYLQNLPDLIRENNKKYTDIKVFVGANTFERLDLEIEPGDSYNSSGVVVRAYRTETDQEMESRIKTQEDLIIAREENKKKSALELEKKEKALYKKLKAKYEK